MTTDADSSQNTITTYGIKKMFSWQYNEKMLKDLIYNHSKDFGRFYCQIMLDSPKLYIQFMEGFNEEYEKRTKNDNKT